MRLQLTAIDTWFFRDSTPFHMDGSPQTGVASIFPPYPSTVAGAVRAALARQAGWDGQTRWRDGELAAVLGDGPADHGRLRITGPFLLCNGAPVFPVPRHVVGRSGEGGADWVAKALLRPGRQEVVSDLGASVRLPDAPGLAADGNAPALRSSTGRWVTLAGLQRILRGELPSRDELLRERDLWATEPRVGIRRSADSRTVEDGALYSTRHVRPDHRLRLGLDIDGPPPRWSPAGMLLPLGGEGRLAECQTWIGPEISVDAPARDARTAVLVALTPVLLEAGAPAGSELAIPGARIVSACLDRPWRIGGWDSRERAPLPLRNAAAPGSVWFCELVDPDAFHAVVTKGLVRAGAGIAAGFGLCATGSAPAWEITR